jgi:hypothetical protein
MWELNRANAVPGYLFRAHPGGPPDSFRRQNKSLSGARFRAELDCLGMAAATGQGKPWIAFAAQKFTGSGFDEESDMLQSIWPRAVPKAKVFWRRIRQERSL